MRKPHAAVLRNEQPRRTSCQATCSLAGGVTRIWKNLTLFCHVQDHLEDGEELHDTPLCLRDIYAGVLDASGARLGGKRLTSRGSRSRETAREGPGRNSSLDVSPCSPRRKRVCGAEEVGWRKFAMVSESLCPCVSLREKQVDKAVLLGAAVLNVEATSLGCLEMGGRLF